MKMQTVLAAKGPRVFTIQAERLVREAVDALSANNIGALIVVDSADHPCGVLSERDIIRELARQPAILDRTVGELMTTDIVTGTPNDDVDSVLLNMTGRHFRHLPIVEDGRLIGVVTTADLVKAQLKRFQGKVETLEAQIMEQPAI